MISNTLSTKRFISVNEASNIFNKSIPTIRKLIELDKISYKKENNRILIELSSLTKLYGDNIKNVSNNEEIDSTNVSTNLYFDKMIDGKEVENEFLKSQIKEKDDQLKFLMEELKESRNQSNTLLLNIQNNLVPLIENQQKMLEDREITTKRKKFLGIF
jgi:dsDNA-specific endonuclease/ATPase MutS2